MRSFACRTVDIVRVKGSQIMLQYTSPSKTFRIELEPFEKLGNSASPGLQGGQRDNVSGQRAPSGKIR